MTVGLLVSLACQNHANLDDDGVIGSVDALLILQHVAFASPLDPKVQ